MNTLAYLVSGLKGWRKAGRSEFKKKDMVKQLLGNDTKTCSRHFDLIIRGIKKYQKHTIERILTNKYMSSHLN
jgi:hypothetical protein